MGSPSQKAIVGQKGEMMKRKIIQIDDEKCNGCGVCIPDCPEGALQMIDGKARLVSDLFCDGLGACIGTCPQGAITTIEREAEAYNERRVMSENIIPKGQNTIKAHLKHLKDHNEAEYYQQAVDVLTEQGIEIPKEEKPASLPCGCPGTLAKSIEKKEEAVTKHNGINNRNIKSGNYAQSPQKDIPNKNALVHNAECSSGPSSQLSQWPIEMHLLSPDAGYFKDADILVAADCTAFSYGNFHNEFLKGRKLIIFCPKLDSSAEAYIEKLTAIFERNDIKSVTVARMEVPCCGGTTAIVEEALSRSGKDIPLNVTIINIDGTLK
jgi:ferredoxin